MPFAAWRESVFDCKAPAGIVLVIVSYVSRIAPYIESMKLRALALLFAVTAFAADITGKWTASFETQIGNQTYTYDFKVDGGKITGSAKSNPGTAKITEGAIMGDDVSFVANTQAPSRTY